MSDDNIENKNELNDEQLTDVVGGSANIIIRIIIIVDSIYMYDKDSIGIVGKAHAGEIYNVIKLTPSYVYIVTDTGACRRIPVWTSDSKRVFDTFS